MAGKIIIRVELKDGQVFQQVAEWHGGNPRWDAQEAFELGEGTLDRVRTAIASVNGDVPGASR